MPKLSTLFFLLTYFFIQTSVCAQLGGKKIAYANLLELEDLVLYQDTLYLCGTVPHTENLKSYPVLVSATKQGDTLWTKEFFQFNNGAKFKQIIVVDDTIYIRGTVNISSYSYEDIILRITKQGTIIGAIQYSTQKIYKLAYHQSFFYVLLSDSRFKKEGPLMIQYNKNLVFNKAIAYCRLDSLTSNDKERNQMAFGDTSFYFMTSNRKRSNEFSKLLFYTKNLDSIQSFTSTSNVSVESYHLLVDKKGIIWNSGRFKNNADQKYFYVKAINSKGEVVCNYEDLLGERYGDIFDMILTSDGDVVVLAKYKGEGRMYVFSNNKLKSKTLLPEYKNFYPKKMLEITPGTITILGLGLEGNFYGHSIFLNWKKE